MTTLRRTAWLTAMVLVLASEWRLSAVQADGPAGASGDAKPVSLDLGGGVKMELMPIPAGEFQMGDKRGFDDEQPVHKVTISKPFWMGKLPVTQEQWKAITGSGAGMFRNPASPVDSISWNHCQAFLDKLNAKFAGRGLHFRLPTEAEWEYACRAGSTTLFPFGDDESRLGDYAWFADNAEGKTHPAGTRKANAWGLHDVCGNVWEWCSDWYAADYYRRSAARDPAGPAEGNERVMRGGSWYRGAVHCRSAARYHGVPACPDYGGGLRVVAVQATKPAAKDDHTAKEIP
ncbi:MAG: Serine/threonine-protein kinase pkn1 [Planctomycetes bacterium ADurb.Bin126]|nr:MAG: Serine/threonine-protein kinase pkn1 [Planctomycetes bacterium ADurb.Bin126]HOD80830.1 formylglycine-generating enzyme family protein [Phycisphaerae bacterium]HQL75686.1 formylglycine-generating enzyme family protein [Phycisphaerae bacterium]